MSRLCLSMIVKNEADKILRCLHSIAPYVSCYAIADTGSTDGTQVLVEEFFDKLGVPGQIVQVPFKDFSQARNAALEAARAYTGSPFDYILLCDADMELVVENKSVFNNLIEKSYNIVQHGGGIVYPNKRLVHRLTPGDYRGVTHEYLDIGNSADLTGVHFIDHADGSNRPQKYSRDIRLLTEGLRQEPNNGRYLYYLANTYRDAGQPRPAIAHYKRRIALGGWDEEIWSSMYEMAKCWKDKKSEDHYVTGMLDAYSYRPSRAETLYDLAHYYRNKGKNAAALIFAKRALATPLSGDALFVSPHAYKYGPLEEISITGFYGTPQERQEGLKAADVLLMDREAPEWSRNGARSNMFHYLQPLAKHLPSFEAKQINFTPPEGYVAMNPSIARIGDRYDMLIRTVNYTMNEQGQYLIRAGDGSITNDNPIHTRTFLVGLYDDLSAGDPKEVTLPVDWPAPKYLLVRSWEDLRLIARGSELWVNAAVREHADDGLPEQFEGQIGHDGRLINWRLMTHQPRECQKNWCPIEGTNDYQYYLGHVVAGRGGPGIQYHKPMQDTDDMRGGTQLVKFNGGWLTIVHEAQPNPQNGKRYYWHRFVYMDHEFKPVHITHPFVFHDRVIEFAMGLVLKDDRVYVSYGRRDCEAWLCSFTRNDLHDWLERS